MSIEHYTYHAGKAEGVTEHEDGTVETLYGNQACGPDTKYVDLPKELGSERVDVIHHMKQKCPMDECGETHSMLILASAGANNEGQLTVVECPKYGFLWCTL